jgi:hypothetical protein
LGAPAADYFGREVEEVEAERQAWSYGRGGSRSDGARRRLPRLGFGARRELGREGKRAREREREREDTDEGFSAGSLSPRARAVGGGVHLVEGSTTGRAPPRRFPGPGKKTKGFL